MSQISEQTITVYGDNYVMYYDGESGEKITCSPKIILRHFVDYPYLISIECTGVLEKAILISTNQAKVINTDSTMTYVNNGDIQDQLILYKTKKGEFYKAAYVPYATDWMFNFFINKIYIKDE